MMSAPLPVPRNRAVLDVLDALRGIILRVHAANGDPEPDHATIRRPEGSNRATLRNKSGKSVESVGVAKIGSGRTAIRAADNPSRGTRLSRSLTR
jgi:hypothetical protein